MDFKNEYNKLNDAQKSAVDFIDGPLIVIAGPGTGKTQLLSMRTANILRLTDVDPENILCLTFTENATENMRSRLHKLVGKSTNRLGIFTFHGFGMYIIQNYPEYFYDSPLITQLSDLGEYSLLEKILDKLHHDNPFAKKINESYLHLPTIIRDISLLKQAGISSDNLKTIIVQDKNFFSDTANYLSDAFKESPNSKNINFYNNLLKKILITNKLYPSKIGKQSSIELAEAIDVIDPSSRYAQSITLWRNKWLSQVKKGKWQYSDQQKNQFLLHLANIYEEYQKCLINNALYTFDDMILRTSDAIENNEELRLTLQEKYQYVLIDEYQDTNGAQDKIIQLLSNNSVNEGMPNLMVVGDDDQAIYRFQGANSSVMEEFIEQWKPKIVVLSKSYRSGQNILDISREVIVNANGRLEDTLPSLHKKLISNSKGINNKIIELYSKTENENYINIANKINALIKKGQSASSISVLAPKHKYLEDLVPHLINLGIPVNYERREQILLQPRIIEIINLIELVSAASKHNMKKIESLLPKILASEYWGLNSSELWTIAINSQKDRKGWFKELEESKNINLNNLIEAIKFLAKESENLSFELILIYLYGGKEIKLSKGRLWNLPWKEFYFSEGKIIKDPSGYLNFMSQFIILKDAFMEWKPDEIKIKTIDNFLEFINIFYKSKIKLINNNNYTNSDDSLNLMSVYKAKGLEWDTVFVLNAVENVWGSKAKNKNQSFNLPTNLKWIEPTVDGSNDLIRLFYVALTRAKKNLYITSYQEKNNGQLAERLFWLDNILPSPVLLPSITPMSIVGHFEHSWRDLYDKPTKDLKLLLKPILSNYKLSSTHLIDFLNIERGGPKYFLYRHLLKVPESLNTSAIYGDAIHKTLEYVHKEVSVLSLVPDITTIKKYFTEKLSINPLTRQELLYFNKKGHDNLEHWINNEKFYVNDISEHDFSNEYILIDDARITGKIDVIRSVSEKELCVIDYKTSNPIESWSANNGLTGLKAYNYQKQLQFYKLLVDNSNYFTKKGVAIKGIIEFLSPDEENNFISLEYKYESKDLDRLKKLITIIWNKIIQLDLPDISAYPSTIKGIRAFEDDLIEERI